MKNQSLNWPFSYGNNLTVSLIDLITWFNSFGNSWFSIHIMRYKSYFASGITCTIYISRFQRSYLDLRGRGISLLPLK